MNVTKIAYLADTHLGNPKKWPGKYTAGINARASATFAALHRAVELAKAAGCVALGIAGDICDYALIEPQILAEAQRILDIPTFLIPGNHDMASLAPGDHALAPLQDHATIVESPQILHIEDIDVWCVPFEPGPPTSWLPTRLQQLEDSGDRRATAGSHLMVHMGVSDSATPYFLDQSSGHISVKDLRALMDQFGLDWAFAGDWHRHQVWDNASRGIVQVGCLAPNRFPPGEHEHGHIGAMVIAEGIDGVELVDVPGPRFAKLSFTDACPASYTLPLKPAPLYLKLTCREGEEDAARKLANDWMASGTAQEVEVVVDRVLRRAAARTAAHEARGASSVDEAIELYVRTMPLPEEIEENRTNVLQRVRKYL